MTDEELSLQRQEHENNALKDPVSKERYKICQECDRFIPSIKVCKECSCFMPLKTMITQVECPIGKWV